LRYWETEFPTVQPVKSPSGNRLYRRQDIETVFEIKRLLYDEGFTIAGARKHLNDLAASGPGLKVEHAAPAKPAAAAAPTKAQRKLLLDLREELAAIESLLDQE